MFKTITQLGERPPVATTIEALAANRLKAIIAFKLGLLEMIDLLSKDINDPGESNAKFVGDGFDQLTQLMFHMFGTDNERGIVNSDMARTWTYCMWHFRGLGIHERHVNGDASLADVTNEEDILYKKLMTEDRRAKTILDRRTGRAFDPIEALMEIFGDRVKIVGL